MRQYCKKVVYALFGGGVVFVFVCILSIGVYAFFNVMHLVSWRTIGGVERIQASSAEYEEWGQYILDTYFGKTTCVYATRMPRNLCRSTYGVEHELWAFMRSHGIDGALVQGGTMKEFGTGEDEGFVVFYPSYYINGPAGWKAGVRTDYRIVYRTPQYQHRVNHNYHLQHTFSDNLGLYVRSDDDDRR